MPASFAPHIYASPLVLDDVTVTGGPFAGLVTTVVIVATSNGDAAAISGASAAKPDGTTVSAGTLLWKTHLGDSRARSTWSTATSSAARWTRARPAT
jgi:hypothetical protein